MGEIEVSRMKRLLQFHPTHHQWTSGERGDGWMKQWVTSCPPGLTPWRRPGVHRESSELGVTSHSLEHGVAQWELRVSPEQAPFTKAQTTPERACRAAESPCLPGKMSPQMPQQEAFKALDADRGQTDILKPRCFLLGFRLLDDSIIDVCVCVCVCARSILSDSLWPVDWSPPGSSVHGIPQVKTLEWVALSFSKGSSWLRNRTWIPCVSSTDRWFLYH